MVCDCKRFNNKVDSNYPGASVEMTCIDCGVGKIYLNGSTVVKIVNEGE